MIVELLDSAVIPLIDTKISYFLNTNLDLLPLHLLKSLKNASTILSTLAKMCCNNRITLSVFSRFMEIIGQYLQYKSKSQPLPKNLEENVKICDAVVCAFLTHYEKYNWLTNDLMDEIEQSLLPKRKKKAAGNRWQTEVKLYIYS